MVEDDVIRELWQVKDARAKRYGYDVRAMVRDLRKKQSEGGNKIIAPRPRKHVVAK
jgi:hypothetical protein